MVNLSPEQQARVEARRNQYPGSRLGHLTDLGVLLEKAKLDKTFVDGQRQLRERQERQLRERQERKARERLQEAS